jgi:hypothetical protein
MLLFNGDIILDMFDLISELQSLLSGKHWSRWNFLRLSFVEVLVTGSLYR